MKRILGMNIMTIWFSDIALLFLEIKIRIKTLFSVPIRWNHATSVFRKCTKRYSLLLKWTWQIMETKWLKIVKARVIERYWGSYSELIWVNAFINTSRSNGSLVPISTLSKNFIRKFTPFINYIKTSSKISAWKRKEKLHNSGRASYQIRARFSWISRSPML